LIFVDVELDEEVLMKSLLAGIVLSWADGDVLSGVGARVDVAGDRYLALASGKNFAPPVSLLRA
jgi:hypothetical protein